MFFCLSALSRPYSRLITCGRNSSGVCNARSMPPSLTRASFRSPTSWSTLLRRHSVACWSVITTTDACASCGWWSWRAIDTFRAFIHLAVCKSSRGVKRKGWCSQRAILRDGPCDLTCFLYKCTACAKSNAGKPKAARHILKYHVFGCLIICMHKRCAQ